MDNLSSSLDLVFGALADPTRRAVLERLGEGDAMEHLVVSLAADPHGFVDEFLAKQGRSRRIAPTVPNFMLALAVIAETDLISALPRTFVAMHGEHFGIVSMEAPLPLDNFGRWKSQKPHRDWPGKRLPTTSRLGANERGRPFPPWGRVAPDGGLA